MANTDRPHGFVPYGPLLRTRPYDQDSGDGTAIFIGDVVDMEADGNISPAAVDSVAKIGAALTYSAASTANPASATAPADPVLVADHPDQLLEAQDDGSGTVAQSLIGSKADHAAGAGSTTTLLSGHELDASDMDGNAAGFAILDIVNRPDNEVADNADWVCQLNTAEGLLTLAAGV